MGRKKTITESTTAIEPVVTSEEGTIEEVIATTAEAVVDATPTPIVPDESSAAPQVVELSVDVPKEQAKPVSVRSKPKVTYVQ